MMNNEEDFLKSQIGTGNPFKVPEGYFDQLAQQVIDRLPEQQQPKPAMVRYLRPLLYAAACVCIALFGVTIYLNKNIDDNNQQQMAVAAEEYYYGDNYILCHVKQ